MKKIFMILFVLILFVVGGLSIRYFTRDWTELENTTFYYYLDEDREVDEDSPLKEWEKIHGKIQEPAEDPFPPSFEEYEDRCGASEIDRSYLNDYSSWKMQCDNMLISGMVSVFLYDEEGNILYRKEKITRDMGSFEEEIADDMMQKTYFLMVLQEEEEMEGSFGVTFYGR